MGLIRGQPRQPWHSTGLASSQPPTPGVAGPGPQTTLRRSMSARETYHRRDPIYLASAPYHVPGGMHNSIQGKPPTVVISSPYPPRCPKFRASGSVSDLRPRGRSRHSCLPFLAHQHEGGSRRNFVGGQSLLTTVLLDADWAHGGHNISSRHTVSSMTTLLPPSSSTTANESTMYGFPSPPLSMTGNEDMPYTNFIPGQGMPMSMPQAPAPPPPQSAPSAASVRQDEYISYYFKYVRELQYVFAGDTLTNVLLPVSVLNGDSGSSWWLHQKPAPTSPQCLRHICCLHSHACYSEPHNRAPSPSLSLPFTCHCGSSHRGGDGLEEDIGITRFDRGYSTRIPPRIHMFFLPILLYIFCIMGGVGGRRCCGPGTRHDR